MLTVTLCMQVQELEAQLAAAHAQLEQHRQAASQSARAAAAAKAAAAASEAEAASQAARATEIEREMRELLGVVEAQKAASAAKMRQLASLLQDM
jgi:leucine-rich repeat/coiled-coil domain-containing protein 1